MMRKALHSIDGMLVRRQMDMRMAVLFSHVFVPVQVFVHQIAFNQEIVIRENLARRTLRHDVMVLIEHTHSIGDRIDDVEIVRRGNHRFPGAPLFDEEIHQPRLAARIEAGRRLIHEPHVGIQTQHRSQRHALLFAARQAVRRPIAQLLNPQSGQGSLHARQDLLAT